MSRRSKAQISEVRYDSEHVRISDEEAHRGVVYRTPGSLSQLSTVYRHQMHRYAATGVYIVPLVAILVVPVLGILLHAALGMADVGVDFSSESFPAILLTFMPFGIIFLVSRFSSKTVSADFFEKTGYINLTLPMRRSVNMAGRYLAAVTMCALALVLLYALVAALTHYYYGAIPPGFPESFAVASVFACAYTAINMVFNTMFRNQGSKLYGLLFIGVPALFLLLVYLGYAQFSSLQYMFPLSDTITAVMGTGFGGVSLFTMVTMFVQVPPVSLQTVDAILLGAAWSVPVLALAMILYRRREM